MICGLVAPAKSATGKTVLNSAALLRDGRIAAIQSKRLLPTYHVFDESGNFAPADKQDRCTSTVLPLRSPSAKRLERQELLGPPLYGSTPSKT